MTMEPPPPSPPPAPPPPPSGAAQPADFTVGEAVGYGSGAFWKNLGPMALIAVVVFAINIAFAARSGRESIPTRRRSIIQLASFLVGMLITLGWMRVALEITRGVKPEVGDLFKASGYGVYILATILFYIGAVIGFILLIVPGIIFVATFGFYGFVIAERGDGVGDHRVSEAVGGGHTWPPLAPVRAHDRVVPDQHRGAARVRDRRDLHVGDHAHRLGVHLPQAQ